MKNLLGVSDPTDWEPTRLPALGPLDAALRCQICKDFYTSAVITNCCHTFCSLCIRRALHAEQICPICRAPEQEYRLRKNNTVQDVVDAFVGSRPRLFELATVEEKPAAASQAVCEIVEADEIPSQTSQRPKRGRGRPKKVVPVEITDDTDDDYVDEHEEENVPEPPRDDGLVACPICQRRMKEADINVHIDMCLITPQPEPARPSNSRDQGRQLRSTPTTTPPNLPSSALPPLIPTEDLKPIPKLTYNLYKEAKLRDKLRELGIPCHGTKKLMQERHTEWTNIWNANVDSSRARSKRELLKDLNTWERAHIKPPNNKTKAPSWSDEDWAARNHNDFNSLVEQAKKNAKRRKVEQESKLDPPDNEAAPAQSVLTNRENSLAPVVEGYPPSHNDSMTGVVSQKSEVILGGLPPPNSNNNPDANYDHDYDPPPSSQQRRHFEEQLLEKRKFSSIDDSLTQGVS